MRFLATITLIPLVGLTACSPMTTVNSGQPRYSHDHITSSEIQDQDAHTAYDLIRKLRPNWLTGRGLKSIHHADASYPVVYVNSSRHGDIESLSTISVNHITEIRFFNSGNAALKYGLDHSGGAILIVI